MDWESSEDSHSFGQRIPPLYVHIKEVLQESPDGQIFKVNCVIVANDYVIHICSLCYTILPAVIAAQNK